MAQRFARLNIKTTFEALDRIKYAREKQAEVEPRPCTQGEVVTGLVMKYLEPRPVEGKAEEKPKRRRKPKARAANEAPEV